MFCRSFCVALLGFFSALTDTRWTTTAGDIVVIHNEKASRMKTQTARHSPALTTWRIVWGEADRHWAICNGKYLLRRLRMDEDAIDWLASTPMATWIQHENAVQGFGLSLKTDWVSLARHFLSVLQVDTFWATGWRSPEMDPMYCRHITTRRSQNDILPWRHNVGRRMYCRA